MPFKEILVGTSKVPFKVPDHLDFIKKVGAGAYGTVASFEDPQTGQKLAVKKITNAFHDLIDGKRILREVKLLRSFNHDNIVSILDMYPPDGPDFDDIYIVTDLMETDLSRVISSSQPLNEEHLQYFTYQILRGLLYLHSGSVVHRDLKPSNLLVNRNCDLKLCDFGLARGIGDTTLTDYVETRWYRAPEVILLPSEYTTAIDIWSVGCILCELLGRKAIFMGKDHLDQVRKILAVLGTPGPEDVSWLPSNGPAMKFLGRVPQCQRKEWSAVYPKASAECREAIDKMLTFHPSRRLTAKAALELPYLDSLHVPSDEPVADRVMDWSFDKFKPTKRLLQNAIYAECCEYHPEIARRDANLLAARNLDSLVDWTAVRGAVCA